MGLLSWLKKLYELLWRPTAGRPWTYVIRDWTLSHPLWAFIVVSTIAAGFVAGQITLTMSFGVVSLPFVLFADFMAFVAGHLFWDSRSVPKKDH